MTDTVAKVAEILAAADELEPDERAALTELFANAYDQLTRGRLYHAGEDKKDLTTETERA